MEKITMESFKNNKLLIAVTLVLAVLASFSMMWSSMQEPVYLKEGESFMWSIVLTIVLYILIMPLTAIWFRMVWNRILAKIFPLKQISYGVAFLLNVIMIVFISSFQS